MAVQALSQHPVHQVHQVNHRQHLIQTFHQQHKEGENIDAPTHLKILNVNAQSILDKKVRFQNLVDSTDPDMVMMTETWLKPDKADGEIREAGRSPVSMISTDETDQVRRQVEGS